MASASVKKSYEASQGTTTIKIKATDLKEAKRITEEHIDLRKGYSTLWETNNRASWTCFVYNSKDRHVNTVELILT